MARRPLAVATMALLCAMLTTTSVLATPRTARPDSEMASQCLYTNEGRQICGGSIQLTSDSRSASGFRYRNSDIGGTVIGGRPAECFIRLPRSRRLIPFCMCAVSVKLFGKVIPELNLASNWPKKFPRTEPAPGMVAARSGHGFLLLSHITGNDWLVYDANSGGGKTREHVRSIRGYVIVNPHGSRMAMR